LQICYPILFHYFFNFINLRQSRELSLKKSILLIVIISLFQFGFLLSAVKAQTTLAVLDFENNSFFNPEEYQPLTKGLADIIITELGQINAVQIVERKDLKTVLDELKLSQSGLLSENNSLQVGKMLGAKNLVFGSFMVTMDEKIRVDLRIVEVETGLTVKADEVTGKTKQVLSLIRKLSKKILKDLDIRLTKTEKRNLDKSQKIRMDAVVYYSKGIDFEDAGDLANAILFYKKAVELEPEFQSAKDKLQKISNKNQ